MKKILVFALLCAALVVGAKFYLEHQYKKELDGALQTARLLAEVEYENLSVGFDGAVRLLNLRITPNSGFDTFKVNAITLSGLDLLFHLNGKSRLEKGEYPPRLNLDIDEVSFPVSVYEDHIGEQTCRSVSGTLLHSSAGFDQVMAKANIDIDLADPFAARVNVSVRDQVSRTNIEIDFNARQTNAAVLSSGEVPIQSMRYTFFLEEEAAKAMVDYCAKQFTVSPEAFLDKVVASEKFMTNSVAVDLGKEARQAMADFLQGGKEVEIRSTPSDRFKNLSFVSTSAPESIVSMLNLQMSVDGNAVPIRTFESAENEADLADDQGVGELDFKQSDIDKLQSESATQSEPSEIRSRRKRKNRYRVATLNKVDEFIDRDIRVSRTNDRSAVEGRLLDSQDKVLSVEIFRHGGVMTFTVPFKDIAKFEVKQSDK